MPPTLVARARIEPLNTTGQERHTARADSSAHASETRSEASRTIRRRIAFSDLTCSIM
jgi:hypothetical protein